MKVTDETAETLTDFMISVERAHATLDAAQAKSMIRACDDALAGMGGTATRDRIAESINDRRRKAGAL